MYDDTINTFEKLRRADTVIIFPVLPDSRILLTKQRQPGKDEFIAAAGGRVDPGENVLDAAHRELLEETGQQCNQLELWKSVQPASKIDWAVYVFIAKDLTKVAEQNLDGGEKIELYPVTFDELLQVARQSNFAEHEIYRDIMDAIIDPVKMTRLRKLFYN